MDVPLFLAGHPIGATGLAQCAELNWQVGIMFSSSLNHALTHMRIFHQFILLRNIFPYDKVSPSFNVRTLLNRV